MVAIIAILAILIILAATPIIITAISARVLTVTRPAAYKFRLCGMAIEYRGHERPD